MVRVIRWNGRDVPPELRELPPGEYAIVEPETLSPEEDAAVQEGLDAVDRGDVVDGETFFRELRARYAK